MAESRQAKLARHGRMFLRIGAVSGFAAVVLGGYGAHGEFSLICGQI